MSSHKQVGSIRPALLFKKAACISAPDVADAKFYHDFQISALNARRCRRGPRRWRIRIVFFWLIRFIIGHRKRLEGVVKGNCGGLCRPSAGMLSLGLAISWRGGWGWVRGREVIALFAKLHQQKSQMFIGLHVSGCFNCPDPRFRKVAVAR